MREQIGDFYFSHDQNAVTDDKILEMRAQYGMEGYGCYWAVVEALSKQSDCRLAYREGKFAALGELCRPSFAMKEFIDACIEIGLFASDGEYFWSESLIRRKAAAQEKAASRSESARSAAAARWGGEEPGKKRQIVRPHKQGDANAMRTHTNADADALPGDANKIKQNKTLQEEEEDAGARAREEAPEEALEADIDPEWKRVVDCYQDNIGLLPHGVAFEKLYSYFEDLGADVLCVAIEQTNERQPNNPHTFLTKILNDWAAKGIDTAARAKAAVLEHERKARPRASPCPPRAEAQQPVIEGNWY